MWSYISYRHRDKRCIQLCVSSVFPGSYDNELAAITKAKLHKSMWLFANQLFNQINMRSLIDHRWSLWMFAPDETVNDQSINPPSTAAKKKSVLKSTVELQK